ncbi:uncharacterized protein LOC108110021 [Drosophila eugracilis]|uniref:uncharacterized protein LOC108110021 n=1 Tax=Drosophila eugracilis TaxID=29029 RepID=UPI0007E5CE79|nr:uncharacterized protein LOC108110021 [Drosophila eugracilis]
MSLFPAYGDGQQPTSTSASEKDNQNDDELPATSAVWKCNESFNQNQNQIEQVISDDDQSSTSSNSGDSSDGEEEQEELKTSPKTAESPKPGLLPLEFDGKDEFYVDKRGDPSLRTLQKLSKPARPIYKTYMRRIWDPKHQRNGNFSVDSRLSKKNSRYTRKQMSVDIANDETETEKLKDLLKQSKVRVQQEPKVLEHWLELHRYLGLNLDKANRLAVAEHQLHTLETALEHHPSNEQILRIYADVANATYSASEVAARFEKMLEKNLFEYTLWTSLIMVTQGNMARCTVPAVLRIYEYCMRKMHVGHTDESSRQFATINTDLIMLKLFYNCALFLRQTGNYNKMFGLIRLTLELNFPGLSMDCLEACVANEGSMIEYEELLLSSGLPMTEIWARVERLRQAYRYLPHTQLSASMLDEMDFDRERCIFPNDVVPYAHSLKSPKNQLHLMLLVVQLIKVPFCRSSCLADKLNSNIDELGESEAIEMLFAGLGDRHTYALPHFEDCQFRTLMLSLGKFFCGTPSYMPHFVGYDKYAETISELLIKSSKVFGQEEDKRMVLMIVWMRFQRILVVINRLMGKLTSENIDEARTRIRRQLRLPENRSNVRMYTEFAMWEYEADKYSKSIDILRKLINSASQTEIHTNLNLMHAYLVLAEILIDQSMNDDANIVLSCLIKGNSSPSLDAEAEIRNLKEVLNIEIAALETLPDEMAVEEYFQENKLMILFRAYFLSQVTDPHNFKIDVNIMFDNLLKNQLSTEAAKNSERRRFLREHSLELQALLLQCELRYYDNKNLMSRIGMPHGTKRSAKLRLVELIDRGLDEFPRNMLMLECWSKIQTMLWYKQRARFIRIKGGILSMMHFVITAGSRHKPSDSPQELGLSDTAVQDCNVRRSDRRMLSIFETFLPTNRYRSEIEKEQYRVLRRNSLFWRLYLKILSNTSISFERLKEVLLMALDECPWDKDLLMDSAKILPSEVVFLQDVMTEKELRIYALPEELDILRND